MFTKKLIVVVSMIAGVASFSACTSQKTCPTYLKKDNSDSFKEVKVKNNTNKPDNRF